MFILQKKILCPQQGPGRSKDTYNTTEYFVSPGEQLYGIQIEAMAEKSILEPIHYVGGRVSVGIIFHAWMSPWYEYRDAPDKVELSHVNMYECTTPLGSGRIYGTLDIVCVRVLAYTAASF